MSESRRNPKLDFSWFYKRCVCFFKHLGRELVACCLLLVACCLLLVACCLLLVIVFVVVVVAAIPVFGRTWFG